MNGIIPLWKPKGLTSHDCVAKIRRLLKTKKVGHTGTLDPEAEGVLPICIGKATKLASLLTNQDKVYEAEISLGKSTTTEDQVGEVLETKSVLSSLTLEECKDATTQFTGEITQITPIYSAVKVNGKKLYEYAREGIEVERPSRQVNIYELIVLSNELNWYNQNDVRFSFKVRCSSGTYIRTLCVDIGKVLDYPAHMSNLIRTKAGSFELSETISLEDLEKQTNEGQEIKLKPLSEALTLPALYVSEDDEHKFQHGQVLDLPEAHIKHQMFKVINQSENLIAIYQQHPSKEGKMKPFKVL
ncbi:tRNA pseudouridine(55) synthase TruB [Filobacillus milosensis]|uniref:tRNA pseudouridine synthase B n=1 Tax=Filobacillus milosensis TaxID=94137 RepID=A0A4Y8IR66_9BACI|nr:tRNA pseudouridine(55) synthase TruB [Filobacillus milosensis]TFB23168.1 tRNA pseudouridine(55) synthase TruB [Filobacillus milosensis]